MSRAGLRQSAVVGVLLMASTPGPSAQEHGAAPAAHATSASPKVAAPKASAPKVAVATPGTKQTPAAHDSTQGGRGQAGRGAPPAAAITEVEPARGRVEGATVAPEKPRVAGAAGPRASTHGHAVAPRGAPAAAAAPAAHAATAAAGAATEAATEAKVQEVTATASADAANRIAAAVRAAAAARPRATPRRTVPRTAARTEPTPRKPEYAVTWPSRSVEVRWPEAPDRLALDWPDQRPPAVRLRWESTVPPSPTPGGR